MVQIRFAHTVPFNPTGADPVLTPAQAWAGLVRKVRNPKDFVPVVSEFELLSDTGDSITFLTRFKPGSPHPPEATGSARFLPPCRVEYELDDGSRSTQIISSASLVGDGGDLFLTFWFEWNHPDLEASSDGAKQMGTKYRLAARNAVEGTVRRVRELVKCGQLE